ncbi:MAG: COX15/CtaA family protein [Bacteroidota bacterium]
MNRGFTRFAWGFLGYNLLVIMWGAFVRASGSGAGCGAHWPSCNGEVIPRDASVETLIELSHRITSGIAGLLTLVLVIWAFRAFAKGHGVRKAAVWTLVFMIIEALIGAGLVLFELVGDNASMGRAVGLAIHLVNTLILVGWITLTAWRSQEREPAFVDGAAKFARFLVLGLIGFLILGASGAVTALGDTLFPAGSLSEGLRQDFSPTAHILLRLRIWHPMIAVVVGGFMVGVSVLILAGVANDLVKRLAKAVVGLVAFQMFLGVINVLLLAPIWMQLVHLLFADVLWICAFLLTVEVWRAARSPESSPPPLETGSSAPSERVDAYVPA